MSTRAFRVSLVVAGLVGLASCLSPLIGLHGVESALVLGLVLPSLAGIVCARAVGDRIALGLHSSPAALVGEATRASVVLFGLPTAILALNALRYRQCEPLDGLVYMALGPLVGTWLGGLTGLSAALVLQRRTRGAAFIAASVPLFAIALGVYRIYDSPAVFSFGHYYGYFPGTIYDELVTLPSEYLWFRGATLALALGLIAWVAAMLDPGTLTLRRTTLVRHPLRAVVGAALILAFAAAEWHGEPLGFRSSSAHIARELGHTHTSARCTLHVPRELSRRSLKRLADDCDFRVHQAEATLGVRHPRRVHAFFFRTPEEKKRLMGAARTYIAKPWRNEVYLQLREWPHPVLAHELAHVIAANVAEGPFRVGGRLGGWLPDPALIEGMAVAMAWVDHDDLTPHQLARALMEIGRMPSIEQLFGLSFLAQPPRNAYTAAGSFLRFVIDHHGKDAARRLYRDGDVARATGKSLAQLDADWHEFLNHVELPPEATALARVRFASGSIFSSVCPHAVARLEAELGQDLAAGDDRSAIRTCGKILEIDSANHMSRLSLAGALARTGNVDLATREVDALEHAAPAPLVGAAAEAIADAAYRAGRHDRARELYRGLLNLPRSVDHARTLEVKQLGLSGTPREAELVLELLIGREGLAASPAVAVSVARELRAVRTDGLGAYLEARQLMNADRSDLAAPLLVEAETRGLPTTHLRNEALRLLGIAWTDVGNLPAAAQAFRRLRNDRTLPEALRNEATDWLQRLQFAVSQAAVH